MSNVRPRKMQSIAPLLVGLIGLFTGIASPVVMKSAEAAVAPLQVKPGRLTPPIQAGALMGGQAALEFSILGIKRVAVKDGVERLVISYGDRDGQPIEGEPGFFNIALDRDSKRVVIDLAQVSRTAVDHKDLGKILASSKLVGSSDMTMDPQDGSTNITLNLRARAAMTVATEKGKTGQIVIELRQSESGNH